MDDTNEMIFIRDLALRCIVGVNPEERREQQDVVIGIAMACHLGKACDSDNIADTVDYKQVKQRVVALVEQSSFFLVEKLADRIAAICLDEPLVEEVAVTVDKPGALRFARSVAVRVCRSRHTEYRTQ